MEKPMNAALLAVNVALFIVCGAANPLLMRFYYLNGGALEWLLSFLQTGAWPALLLPIALSSLGRGRKGLFKTPSLAASFLGLGVLTGLSTLCYSFGVSLLPASTVSILGSTQLAFTAGFAFLIVRQRFTACSVGGVALLCAGAVALGLGAGGDRPEGETAWKYLLGFLVALGGSACSGLQLPLVETAYGRAGQGVSYGVVLEAQLLMGITASIFSLAGMLLHRDFQAIPKEAEAFGQGKVFYYTLLAGTAITSQLYYLGIVGTIFYASALLAGIIQALLVPIVEVLAVFFFKERFTTQKALALALSLFGLAAYFYGDFMEHKQREEEALEGDDPESNVHVHVNGDDACGAERVPLLARLRGKLRGKGLNCSC